MDELTVNRNGKDFTFRLPDGWEIRDDITQGDLEKWEAEYNKTEHKGRATDYGAIVRAAIKANWFDECPYKMNQVNDANPKQVAHVARFIDALYTDIMFIPDFLS